MWLQTHWEEVLSATATEPGELDTTDNVCNGDLSGKKCERSPLRANNSKLVQLQNRVLSGKRSESERSSVATISCVSEKAEPVNEASVGTGCRAASHWLTAAGRFTEGTERDNQYRRLHHHHPRSFYATHVLDFECLFECVFSFLSTVVCAGCDARCRTCY